MKYYNNLKLALLTFCSLFIISDLAMAVPATISHHGMIYKDGEPVNASGNLMLMFIQNEDGSNEIAQLAKAVDVVDGYYSISMELNNLDYQKFINATEPLFLKIQYNGEIVGKLPLNSVPYALKANDAEHAANADVAENAKYSEHAEKADLAEKAMYVQDNGIVTQSISNGVVTLDKLAKNAVDSTKIVNGSIATDDLAANAVTTEKISNGTITDADLNKASIINWLYPKNSIIISYDNVNPSVRFGGQWEQFASGRTLVGVGTAVDDRNQSIKLAEKTEGGNYETKLSVNELPSHTHTAKTVIRGREYDDNGSAWGALFSKYTRFSTNDEKYHEWYEGNVSTTVNSTGSGKEFSNMMPYITVYFWRRIS